MIFALELSWRGRCTENERQVPVVATVEERANVPHSATALQRKEPVTARRRLHGKRHQADCWRRPNFDPGGVRPKNWIGADS